MLEEIITNFDIDKIRTFFFKKENSQFVRKYEEIPNFDCCHFSNGIKIGEIEFTDKNQYFAVYAFKVSGDLTEYSGKKGQYDLAKKVLKNQQKDAGIFVFYDEHGSFRFSLVFPIYSGNHRVWNTFKRYTYFVSKDQTNKTFLSQIGACEFNSLEEIQEAFSVEKVTKDFFSKYVLLFNKLVKDLDSIQVFRTQAEMHAIKTEDFAKKLLGQIVFLYFLQKKGWLGVPKEKGWGDGDRKFLRNIFEKCKQESGNFYNDYLEYLFYDTLNNPRTSQNDSDYSERFRCKIPYLNGGLFEPEYDWKKTVMRVEDPIFSEILDTFDQFNFTIDENTPSDVEVSVDPEMLGKIFENLLPENIRKGKGAFYTPREIVQYMCKESLINYLNTKLLGVAKEMVIKDLVNFHLHLDDDDLNNIDSLDDVSEASENVGLLNKYSARKIDDALSEITVVDPACGSGAFLVGILNEIIGIRQLLHNYYLGEKRSVYDLRKETILNSIYGVDIDPGAVDIAKLRLWLALVVDAKRPTPLPNLDFKIMQGNSLLEEYNGTKFYEEDSKNKLNLPDIKLDKTRKKLSLAKSSLFNADTEDKKKEARKEIVELTNVLVKDILEKQKIQSKKKLLIDLRGDGTTATKSKKYIESTLENIEIDGLVNNLANPKYPKPFFLWKLNFCEVFEEGGFDIVIGNPPYIDSEGMVKNNQLELRERIQKIYNWTKGNWDIYIAFFEIGFRYMHNRTGILVYITPDKWISKPFGDNLRKGIIDNIFLILKSGRKIFDNAKVDSIVTFLSKKVSQNLKIAEYKDAKFVVKKVIDKNSLQSPFSLDHLFSENFDFISKISSLRNSIYSLAKTENACATSDAYKLKPFIENINEKDFDKEKYFKVINTGTISKYFFRWGIKAMTYLGDGYFYPVVNRKIFLENFKNSYGKKSLEPKIIIKGLNLLDGCIDLDGNVIPAKTTLIVTSSDKDDLKFILGIINSSIAIFYIKERYPAASYNQGISFTKDMINNFPLPEPLDKNIKGEIVRLVDQILTLKKQNKDADTKNLESQIDQLVYKLYDLTPEEIEIVENSTK